MAAFDFPASPTVGQVYDTGAGVSYVWDGVAWKGNSGIGGGYLPLSGGTLTGNLIVNIAAPGNALDLVSTDATASSGPRLDTYRRSASPAVNDTIGSYVNWGRDLAGADVGYTAVYNFIDDPTTGSQDGMSSHRVAVNGGIVERLQVNKNGILTQGVTFPAAQVASAAPNTLDDYEEGLWTPTLRFGGAGVGMTFSGQSGSYVKVGSLVTANFDFALSAKGSSVGGARVNLPFSANTTGGNFAFSVGYFSAMTAGFTSMQGYVSTGTPTELIFTKLIGAASTTVTVLADTDFTNTSRIIGSITYVAA